MGIKAKVRNSILGWFPQELNIPRNHGNINGEDQETTKFQFNRRFWVSLAMSYSLFVLLVVVPFLLGYIDASVVGYGLTGIGWSLACMAIVYAINRRPELRRRAGYVAVGVWSGFAVFALFALVLFPHQFLAAGSGTIILLLTIAPATGGVVGYFAGKRKVGP